MEMFHVLILMVLDKRTAEWLQIRDIYFLYALSCIYSLKEFFESDLVKSIASEYL